MEVFIIEEKKLSKAEVRAKHKEIEDMYVNQNKGIKEIAKILNTHRNYISQILDEFNISKRSQVTGYRENPQIIIDMYNKGISSEQIATNLNIGPTTVLRVLHENNIKIRSMHEAKLKYFLDETYFDEIDTPNKAYVLGLFYADGCNHAKRNYIKLALQIEDEEVLEKIRKEMKIEKPLKFESKEKIRRKGYNHKDTKSIDIYSKQMSEALTKLGCVEQKSLVLEWPSWLREDLYSHFIRGYFDGDGSISKGRGYQITYASTYMFLEKLKEILEERLEVKLQLYDLHENGITYDLCCSNKSDCKKILDYMYKDAEIYMERKYNIYLEKFYNNKDN